MKHNIKYKLQHLIFYSVFISSLSIILYGCPTPPEFEAVPSIAYESIAFSQIADTSASGQLLTQDIISLTIQFEDGNGDLGLRSSELNPPYNLFDIPLNNENELIFFGSQPDLPPFNFYDYYIPPDSTFIQNTLLVDDTIYVRFNERHFNIYISFFYQPPGSEDFIQFEWERERGFYQSFHGRFPILNTEDYDRPLNGTITYDLASVGFRSIFRNYPMYIETYILDRAGNRSNTIQSEIIRLIQ